MRILIAIDDTDNLQSRGTGYLARSLAAYLEENGVAVVSGITRHQLFVHEDIPYTSHNSAACLDIRGDALDRIAYLCRVFVKSGCAPGSDAGLCIVPYDRIGIAVVDWGHRAKREVLHLKDAVQLAAQHEILLEGLSGTRGGMIGALAAVGLHKSGNDGRFLWVRGMRKYMGVMSCREIYEETGVEEVRCGEQILESSPVRIKLPEWWRPVLSGHRKVLRVIKVEDNDYYEYELISKDNLRRISA